MRTSDELQRSETGVNAKFHLTGVASNLVASIGAISNEIGHSTSFGGGTLKSNASDVEFVLGRLADLDGSEVSHAIESRSCAQVSGSSA